MATWHQMKRPVQLAHATQWSIVTDPPNDCRTVMRFPTEQAARDSLAQWRARGDRHSYILPPLAKG